MRGAVKQARKTFTEWLKWLFVIVPLEHRHEFRAENIRLNIARGRFTTIFIGTMQLIMLVLGIGGAGNVHSTLSLNYLILYLVVMAGMLAFFIIFTLADTHPPNSRTFRCIEVGFLLFLLLWTVGISLLDQEQYGQITFYVMGVFASAVVPLLEPVLLLVLLLLPHTLLLVCLPYVQENYNVLYGHIVNTSVLVLLAWAVSRLLFSNRLKDFLNQRIITAQNNRLSSVNRSLASLSELDDLTQTLNRRGYLRVSDTMLDEAVSAKTCLALMIIDIDYFKEFNDNYGHLCGDVCLKNVAETLSKSIRDGVDCISRYGGDEFVVLLPDIDNNKAEEIAERMRARIEALAIENKSSRVSEFVTVSIGCLTLQPHQGMDINELFKQADKALYMVKEKRRNSIAITDYVGTN